MEEARRKRGTLPKVRGSQTSRVASSPGIRLNAIFNNTVVNSEMLFIGIIARFTLLVWRNKLHRENISELFIPIFMLCYIFHS